MIQPGERHPRVEMDRLDFENDYVMHLDGVPLTGIGFELESTGALSEVEYVAGREHGIAIDWDAAGRVQRYTVFRGGCKHGFERELDELGRTTSLTEYRFGRTVATWDVDDSGVLAQSSAIEPGSAAEQQLDRLQAEFGWTPGDDPYQRVVGDG